VRLTILSLALVAAAVAAVPARAASLADMAGQMIIVGFKGDSTDDASIKALTAEIAKGQIGGVMYLRPNVKSLDSVKAMNAGFKAASPTLPPFITLDQEGGKVQRLTSAVGFPEMPGAFDIAQGTVPKAAGIIYSRTATELAGLGFNVNFGPVVDLNINPNNPIIGHYGRSFSADPAKVTTYAEAFINAHHKAGMLTALKHFPGHGSSTTDSHKGFVDISSTWSPSELSPYKTLFKDEDIDFVWSAISTTRTTTRRATSSSFPRASRPCGSARCCARTSATRASSSATTSRWAPSATCSNRPPMPRSCGRR